MKKYFIYKNKKTNEIKVYLAKTDADIERVTNILKDENNEYMNIHTFSDNDMFFTLLTAAINRMLNEIRSPVLFRRDRISTDRRVCLNVALGNSMFVDSCILNMSDEFWAIIEDVLTTFELNYDYNNTRSCIFISKKEED